MLTIFILQMIYNIMPLNFGAAYVTCHKNLHLAQAMLRISLFHAGRTTDNRTTLFWKVVFCLCSLLIEINHLLPF